MAIERGGVSASIILDAISWRYIGEGQCIGSRAKIIIAKSISISLALVKLSRPNRGSSNVICVSAMIVAEHREENREMRQMMSILTKTAWHRT